MKKIIGIILALAMCLSLLPVAALATQNEETSVEFTADQIFTENTQYDNVTVAPGVNVTVKSGICLTVEKELCGAVCGEQDAQLEIGANATVTGITLYDANCTDTWRDFSHREVFVWLEKDDQEQDIKKWVRFVPESGYDSFGPTAELPYMVEFHWNGGGNATVQGEYDQMPNGNNTKVRVANTVESLTFELHPNENERIDGIRVEQEGVAETNPDGFVDLDNDNRYNSTDNTFTLNLTDSRYNDSEATGIKFVNINFDFTGGQPGPDGPQGPGENQYRMFYSDMGSVTGADNNAILDFTKDQAITWTLTYPQNVTNLYRVEINVNGEQPQHYEYNDGADNNSTEIAVNNDEKTISYTPTSTDPFEVFIYWTEQDRFNQFGFNPDEEIQLQCRVLNGFALGTDIDAPWCDCAQDGGWRDVKINVPKDTQSFTITFSNEEGYEFDKAVFADAQDSALTVDTTEGIAYTWAAADFSKELNVYFKQSGEPGPNPPEPQEGVDWTKLTDALENYIFAYGESSASEMKTLMAKELSERRIGDGLPALGEALGMNASQLEGLLTLSDTSSTTNSIIPDLPYYTYSLAVTDVDPTTEGDQNFAINGKVYILNTARDVIVESEKNSTTQYQIITLSAEEFGTTCAYIDADSIVGVYGNAAMCNGIEGGGEDIFAAHVTQEHAGRTQEEMTFPIGARLVLTLEENTVKLTPNAGGDAAPWSFQNVGVYSGTGTESDPVEATMFYGAPSIKLEKATGSKTITNVEVTNLPETAIQYIADTGVVNFKTNYDVITLKITYDGGSVGYITLSRVGLDIKSIWTDKEADVQSGDRFSDEDKAACTGDSFNVWHGTDQSVRYTADKDIYVIGSFYYDDETVCEGAGKADQVTQHYSELSNVNLFITIEKTDGSFEYRTVADAITLDGTAVNNGGFIEDNDNAPGYAGQGSNHFYDDFVLWSGSEADFENIKSVSAIAFHAGDADSFGGVRVGSGAGVEWTKPTTR